MLLNMIPEAALQKAVIHNGIILVGGDLEINSVFIEDFLFDSGALDASFIRQDVIDANRELFADAIRPIRGSVRLADDGTVVIFKEMLHAIVSFVDSSGEVYEAMVDFYVLPALSKSAIIGLPDIVASFLPLFNDMLQGAWDSVVSQRTRSSNNIQLGNQTFNSATVKRDMSFLENKPILGDNVEAGLIPDDVVYPWESIEQEADEELEVDLPCAFRDALHFMEMPVDEARKEYLDLCETQASPWFKAIPGAMDYLREFAIKAFVPSNWEGIKMSPIEFKFKEGMPDRRDVKARPVNPRLLLFAKKEFDRLLAYFYEYSSSPIVSPLVIAPKATKPFIRFCGDHKWINEWIHRGHTIIPHIRHSLEKIIRFTYFVDIDLVNAYHQFKLGPLTSELLSIITPWGQVRPKFLPEGVSPATDIIQSCMQKMFGDFEEWSIILYDNILLLAYSPQDAFKKFKTVVDRAIEYNIFFKLSKTWLCVEEVTFFGYVCRKGSFCLSDKRKAEIAAFPFPDSLKKMRSFLGSAGFFQPFVNNFATIVAPLHDMTKKSFDWKDKSKWQGDYEQAFENFKKALMDAVALFYPDYELRWILRTDASDFGVGWVLIMVKPDESQSRGFVELPIAFGSRKFSEQAIKWNVMEKEAFAFFASFKSLDYYLRAKPFELETDHRNLRWMEKSENAKIVRWRIYMQGFTFFIRDIPRSQNAIADWESKFHSVLGTFSMLGIQNADNVTKVLGQVHGKRSGHHGVRRTWKLLNKHFPGHRIPYKIVEDFIWNCAICQKFRLGMNDQLESIVRHLVVPNARSTVGVDYLSLEEDRNGNIGCYVFRNFFTKWMGIYPSKDRSAESLALAIFWFSTTFGLFDNLASDPGSEMTSAAIRMVNEWFGIHHILSLVDRHESNGVESGNKDILRYLKTILADERRKDRWSDISIIGWVSLVINLMSDSETGISPVSLTFGSKDASYFKLPDPLNKKTAPEFLRQLDADLESIREATHCFQQQLVKERTKSQTEDRQNQYQPGDFVLYQRDPSKPLPSKFVSRFKGPFEVQYQRKNDVTAKHLAQGGIVVFHNDDLKIFHGAREEAYAAAVLDNDQFVVLEILAHRGEPHERTTMEFFVRYADEPDNPSWQPWSQDLFKSVPYGDYCSSKTSLFQLVHTVGQSAKEVSRLNKLEITTVKPDDTVYVDLRWFGAEWYRQMSLPDCDFKTYVVIFKYERYVSKKRKIIAYCPVFNDRFTLDHVFVFEFGSVKEFNSETMILVDLAFVTRFPKLQDSSGTPVYSTK